ncbi:hypothetical protein K502DRAFT_326269 [Neoconidiobolus thromboides FSU 785]|nr:hypothetical protein K502DRAFT_326269 [Neoconidiobolus thromboides FSU 785]
MEENEYIKEISSDEEINYEKDELYDSELDEEDSKFMTQKFKDNQSDATLLCPLCLIPICYSCQRHVKYKGQYRAMVVENVELNLGLKLIYSSEEKSNNNFRELQNFNIEQINNVSDPAELLETNNTFFPVHCKNCSAKVGVYDSQEMFHFFDVVAMAPQ